MDTWSFGLTLLVVGIVGTFATLGLLAGAMALLKKAFPLEPGEKK